jgi:tetratricopeptide (TPR) repeat protein
MLANAYLRGGKWLAAAGEYEKSEKLRPNHPDTPLNLGYAYYHAGNSDEAVKAWRKAVALSPRDALPAASLALGLRADGHEREARECMAQTIRLDPGWNRRVSLDFRWSLDMRRDIDKLAKASGDIRQAASQHF